MFKIHKFCTCFAFEHSLSFLWNWNWRVNRKCIRQLIYDCNFDVAMYLCSCFIILADEMSISISLNFLYMLKIKAHIKFIFFKINVVNSKIYNLKPNNSFSNKFIIWDVRICFKFNIFVGSRFSRFTRDSSVMHGKKKKKSFCMFQWNGLMRFYRVL